MSRATWIGLAAVVALVGFGRCAEARPGYCKEFLGKYADNKAAAEAKCGSCHGASKKDRNGYGAALGKALGGADVKDADKIKAALTKIESEKSAVDGKTFGDLLKEGKLPGSK